MLISAILGFTTATTIWIVILITQSYSRWAGLAWMVVGLIIYYLYRRRQHMPLTHTSESWGK